jgi:uncharacterized coiled-coil protein SlyX
MKVKVKKTEYCAPLAEREEYVRQNAVALVSSLEARVCRQAKVLHQLNSSCHSQRARLLRYRDLLAAAEGELPDGDLREAIRGVLAAVPPPSKVSG